MKTKHTFTHDNGRVSSRTSARAYTHVIIGRKNLAAWRAEVQSPAAVKRHQSDWKHIVNVATTPVGQCWEAGKSWTTVTSAEHARYKPEMLKHETEAAYIAACIESALERINAAGQGDSGEEEVLQWSMSYANASKATGSWGNHYVDVAVRPVD